MSVVAGPQSCTSEQSRGQEQALSIASGTSLPFKDDVTKGPIRLESELCLFVRERSVEIVESNQSILFLEKKITKLEEINDLLKSAIKLGIQAKLMLIRIKIIQCALRIMIMQCNQQAFCVREMQTNLDNKKTGTFDSSMNKNKEPFHTESNNSNLKESDPRLHEIDQSKLEFM